MSQFKAFKKQKIKLQITANSTATITTASSNCEVFYHRKSLFHEECLYSADRTQLAFIRNCVKAAKR